MCGIVAVVDLPRRRSSANHADVVGKMADEIAHRGPDDRGIWLDEGGGVALGHRRLSILDLTQAGHQPMTSRSARFVVVYNGEIYNFSSLRDELAAAGASFTGGSDTEVLLAACERWGFVEALPRLVGMFAIVCWDSHERILHLARDRMGEKPVYYGWLGDGTFVAASELKALRAHPAFVSEIDRDAVALYLRHLYLPAPHTIYRGMRKLPAGARLAVQIANPGERPEPRSWWSVRAVAESAVAGPLIADPMVAEAELDRLLRQSVAGQLVADVPVGAFLSGGIDSSTVVAVMQAISPRPVRTFTIGFHESQYNEANHAREVAKHLGTDHTDLHVTADMARAVIPRLPTIYDEPFADSSQIPTFLVAQLARRQVAVALSGDGGDELFGGYTRYAMAERLWSRLSLLPGLARRGLAHGMLALSPAAWDRLGAAGRWLLPRRHRHGLIGDKVHKLARVVIAGGRASLYRHLVSHWDDPGALVVGCHEPSTVLGDESLSLGDYTRTMMLLDQLTYLPDDILVKVDRAAMAVGLETRVPMLDHRIVEFAWRLAPGLKVRRGVGKWILRRVLDRYVPRHLIERPKMGFAVPLDSWSRGPLRPWAEALLDEGRLRREGIFDPVPIRRCWDDHLTGRHNRVGQLWGVLMFQAWWEVQRS